ncbi:MAG: putative bifunctional diguanylate cyclase/phosphodiesterase [Pseudomonadales bacterium]
MKEQPVQLACEGDAHSNVFLIAEDSPVDEAIVRGMLEEVYHGQFTLHSVARFADIEAALASGDYEVLILDMNLPDSTGPEAVNLLSESHPELPVVVLTAQGDLQTAAQSFKLGAQDFLAKSQLTPQLLSRSLHYAIERKKVDLALRRSIGEIEEKNSILERLAHTDFLTNLPNRAHFESSLSLMIERAKRAEQRFALLYIDLNDFKSVNDSFGHAIGDTLLRQVAQRLLATVRSSDFVGRIGGDEFVIFTDFIEAEEEVYHLVDRLSEAFDIPFSIERKEIQNQPSIGVAFYPKAATFELLMKHADHAMYEVKSREDSDSPVGFYTDDLDRKYARKLQIQSAFNGAIERSEFQVFFQRVEDLDDPECYLFEALLRWNSQQMGVVSPAEFIPIFENSPVINQLTKLVLAQARDLHDRLVGAGKHLCRIKVNVTASQLSSAVFCDQFLSWMEEYAIPPARICLELTERQVIKNTRACLRQLKKLRQRGVGIALDDFGTGFTSVKHIIEFPIDYLKIDISLIRDIHKRKRNQALVAGIVEMGHRLKLKIVAEGVETREQYEVCKSLKCDMLQGYYIHKPAATATLYQQFL